MVKHIYESTKEPWVDNEFRSIKSYVLEVSYDYMERLSQESGKRVEQMIVNYLNRNSIENKETVSRYNEPDGLKIVFKSRQQFIAYKQWARENISPTYEV